MRHGLIGVAFVCLLASAGARAERPPATWAEVTLLAAAEASLAIDLMQTLDIKRHPGALVTVPGGGIRYRTAAYETNPIIGSNPSDVKIGVYFAGAMLLTGAAWYVLPERFRFLAPLVVLVLEVPQIERNARAGMSVRF